MYLSDFHSIQPPFSVRQNDTLKWLAAAYKIAQKQQTYSDGEYLRLLERVACVEPQILNRGFFVPDASDTDWSAHSIYPLHLEPQGARMSQRQEFFQASVKDVFAKIYENRKYPDDIVHVSCTGYISPSAAQLLALKSPKPITVTHSYHMGCYGAFPALRIGSSFLTNSSILGSKKSVDVIHTELCSLHLNPQDPSLEQMVIQSLFADGVIAYSLTNTRSARGLHLLSLYEELIPDTAQAMEWMVAEFGMKMTLSKDVPTLVGHKIREFTVRWLNAHNLDMKYLSRDTIFAIHPGGPKIIDQVAQQLELAPEQVQFSRDVLRDHGNISSATLPHLWQRIVEDASIPSGTPIISYAFGPGLTVCAGLMEKL